MSKGKGSRFYWCIHIETETHGKVLKIIICLDSEVNKSTNPVIEGNTVQIFNWFQLLSNNKFIH